MAKVVSQKNIEQKVLSIRSKKIMLDRDLAYLYGIETRTLKQAVKRNSKRFPADFMFYLTDGEIGEMVSQNVIPSKSYFGGSLPMAFTEQGVAMLSSVLNTETAIRMNIQIMRVFSHMRRMVEDNRMVLNKLEEIRKELTRIDQIEHRQDTESKALWNAIHILQRKLIP